MQRRALLRAIAATGVAAGMSGCASSVLPDSESTQTAVQRQEKTEQPLGGSVSWSESWIGGENYALVVTAQLHTADRIVVETLSGKTVASITTSGEQKIAGEGTEFGYLELGTGISAMAVRGEERSLLGTFTVGSQDQMTIPFFLNGLSGGTGPEDPSGEQFSRTYTQSVYGAQTSFQLNIPKELYQYYKDRRRTAEYGVYVSDRNDDRFIESITSEIERFSDANDLSDREMIDHTVAIVQNLKYTQDKAATGYNEYPKYPVETLVDRGGDCEDTSILLAEFLEKLGYGTVLLLMRNAQHMAVGVKGDPSIEGTYYELDGDRYYYLETTAGGWTVGELPDNISDSSAELVQVLANPVLIFGFVVSVSGEGGATVETAVRNVGDQVAENTTFKIEFEDRQGNIVESGSTDLQPIQPDARRGSTFQVRPPDDRALKARAGVLLNGTLHDTVETEFREPAG